MGTTAAPAAHLSDRHSLPLLSRWVGRSASRPPDATRRFSLSSQASFSLYDGQAVTVAVAAVALALFPHYLSGLSVQCPSAVGRSVGKSACERVPCGGLPPLRARDRANVYAARVRACVCACVLLAFLSSLPLSIRRSSSSFSCAAAVPNEQKRQTDTASSPINPSARASGQDCRTDRALARPSNTFVTAAVLAIRPTAVVVARIARKRNVRCHRPSAPLCVCVRARRRHTAVRVRVRGRGSASTCHPSTRRPSDPMVSLLLLLLLFLSLSLCVCVCVCVCVSE